MAATIKDVAKRTGLSTATISKYINGVKVQEKNKLLIDEAIKELDFTVNTMARGLKTSKTMTIGVLIPDLENIFCTGIITNIENILMQYGYSTIICDYKLDVRLEGLKMDFLLNKMVDGIVFMPLSNSADSINKAVAKNVPVVLIDRPVPEINCDMVLVDNLNASYCAIEHLITRGHRNIGIICGQKDIYTAQERLKGYNRVFEDYGMQINEENIKYGNYQLESGYYLMREFLESETRPTAAFITNYEMTIGAFVAINENNIKIPEEMSVIGFDNLTMSKIIKPALSVVIQPMKQIGETVANLIMKRLKGDTSNFPSMYRLKTELLMQESVSNLVKK